MPPSSATASADPSLQPDAVTLLRSGALVAFTFVLVAIIYATVVPIALRPKTGHVHPERMLAYFALGAALITAYPRAPWRAGLLIIAIACGLEWVQIFIPTRDGRISDAVEKSLGGAAGIVAGWVLHLIVAQESADRSDRRS